MLHEQDKFGWERQPQIAGSTIFLSIRSSVLEAAQNKRAFSLRLVNQRSAQRYNRNIPHDQRAMDRGIRKGHIASRLAQSAIENQGQEYVMTTPTDDTLTAIGRQLSITYLPTVLEPLPRELNDLVAQLVAFEMRKRDFECDHLGYRDTPFTR